MEEDDVEGLHDMERNLMDLTMGVHPHADVEDTLPSLEVHCGDWTLSISYDE